MLSQEQPLSNPQFKTLIEKLVRTELEAMAFYRSMADSLPDEDTRFHFDLLAEEELEHGRSFYDLYQGPGLQPFEMLVDTALENRRDLADMTDHLDQLGALKLAMNMECAVETNLNNLAMAHASPEFRAILIRHVEATRGHYLLIKADYERLKSSPSATRTASSF